MLINNSEYLAIVNDIKSRIHAAQYRAVLAANSEMIDLYWNIGTAINANSTWGNKFIENLARDIKLDFPDAKGYSIRNLKYMKKFAVMFPDFGFVQVPLAQITWYHHITLMDKVKNHDTYLWYAAQTVENGWSRNTLVHQIEYELYERQAIATKVSNFAARLPSSQSELVEQSMRDPYIFDFVNYRKGMIELEIEAELVRNITKLLLELGTGFAFMGNQYPIEVENEIFKIDLLFYNVKLRCYVVIELKTGDFRPEYAGKLNFYISAVDDLMRGEYDNPTVGLLLCKNKRGMIAEYSLRDIDKPIGVSEYKLFDKLPKEYADILPSAEDIEKRIGAIDESNGDLKPLTAEQLPQYADVIRRSFATVAADFGWTREIAPTFTAFITDERLSGKIMDGYYPFGLYVDDEIVGFVSLTDSGNSTFELNNLAVLPDYRHLGYGKQLLDFCKAKVVELGGARIIIGIVDENIILKEWYVDSGFVHTGTKKFEHQPFTAGFLEWKV